MFVDGLVKQRTTCTSVREALYTYGCIAGQERLVSLLRRLPESRGEHSRAFVQLHWLYKTLVPLLLTSVCMDPVSSVMSRLDPIRDIPTTNTARKALSTCAPFVRSMCGIDSGAAQALFGISLIHAGDPVTTVEEIEMLASTCLRGCRPYVVSASPAEAEVIFDSIEDMLVEMVNT